MLAYVMNFCGHGEKVASKFSLAGINESTRSTWNGRGRCLLVIWSTVNDGLQVVWPTMGGPSQYTGPSENNERSIFEKYYSLDDTNCSFHLSLYLMKKVM